MVDSEGNLTLTATHYADTNDLNPNSENISWAEYNESLIYKTVALVMGDQLYLNLDLDVYTAQGDVSGIVGTWTLELMLKFEFTNYVTTYVKWEYIFSTDGAFTTKEYESNTGTYGLPKYTDSGTYTYSNGTLTMTVDEESQGSKAYIYNNKYLIIGDEKSYSVYAYVKQ